MGRWRPEEERLNLGARAVYLRDEEELLWRDVAERLGLRNETQAILYYRAFKKAVGEEKEMSVERIERIASKYGIEPGWILLYERGFRRRVPKELHQKIEDAKIGVGSVEKGSLARMRELNKGKVRKRLARRTQTN